ncbi:MAG TPA: histidine phosphatase family protein [Casimicrobiaceae bacterium]|nr:histidine phosphatase family protein [Casimicrobiaceae bacterium]
MIVAFVRHGRTAWNAAQRLQGRADVPLSPEGRAQVLRWRLPADLASARMVASPLARAVDTARLLGAGEPAIEPALVEMDWGGWEGETFASLRAHHARAFAAAEARGLDFRPPGGESIREVQARLLGWLAGAAGTGAAVVAVTHKGVLNALVAHLTGWNAIGRSPVKLRPDVVHLVEVGPRGELQARSWNVPLTPAGPAA